MSTHQAAELELFGHAMLIPIVAAAIAIGACGEDGPREGAPRVGVLTVSPADLSVVDVYRRVGQAISRQDSVLHTTMRSRQDSGAAATTIDYWIDAARRLARYESASDVGGTKNIRVVVRDGYSYRSADSGPAEREPVETNAAYCPGTKDALISALLWCAGKGTAPADGTLDSRIELVEYEGQAAIVLVVEEVYVTTLGGYELPPPTGGTVPPTVLESSSETRNTSRTYVSLDTFLPVAREYAIVIDGESHDTSLMTYQHEFLPIDDVPSDFFDPSSIGYTGDGEPTP